METDPEAILDSLLTRYHVLGDLRVPIWKSYEILRETVRNDGIIFTCGNGGSAADADHIVGELLKSFRLPRPLHPKQRQALQTTVPGPERNQLLAGLERGIKAVSLVGPASLATAIGNDIGGDLRFAQPLSVLGGPGDVLIALSTSGNSRNVCLAAATARSLSLPVVGLTGASGGRLADHCTEILCVPETETFRVQELHLPLYHALCAMLEADQFPT